jgi:hypothetical protein
LRRDSKDAPEGIGSKIHTISWVGKRKSEFDEEAIEFVPNKKVTWRIIGAKPPFKMTSAWIFEPTANGTKLTNSGEYSLPYSVLGILLDKVMVHKDLEKGLIKFQENIKKAGPGANYLVDDMTVKLARGDEFFQNPLRLVRSKGPLCQFQEFLLNLLVAHGIGGVSFRILHVVVPPLT